MSKLRIMLALAASALLGIAFAASAAPGRPNEDPTGARGVAARSDVPLPAGGNFNGIQWERAGVEIPPSAIQGTLEYNAACQWLRAWRDGRETGQAIRTLRAAPGWSFLRGSESGQIIAQVAREAAGGGGGLATGVLADCDAAHDREVAYAIDRGLTPST
jgi:hypothetical protein